MNDEGMNKKEAHIKQVEEWYLSVFTKDFLNKLEQEAEKVDINETTSVSNLLVKAIYEYTEKNPVHKPEMKKAITWLLIHMLFQEPEIFEGVKE